jgi:hypothetical protein
VDELIQLDEWLERHGVDLVFAEMKGPVKDRLLRYGMGSRFSREHFYPPVSEAVRAFQREAQPPHPSRAPPSYSPYGTSGIFAVTLCS